MICRILRYLCSVYLQLSIRGFFFLLNRKGYVSILLLVFRKPRVYHLGLFKVLLDTDWLRVGCYVEWFAWVRDLVVQTLVWALYLDGRWVGVACESLACIVVG